MLCRSVHLQTTKTEVTQTLRGVGDDDADGGGDDEEEEDDDAHTDNDNDDLM